MLAFLIFLSSLSWADSTAPASAAPFWKAKPAVYRKVVEERLVVVSVTDHSEKGADGKARKIMKLKGGGQVHAPKDVAVPRLLDFREVFNNSRYIKKITVDEKHQTLFVRAVAYGFSNSMKITWKVDKNEADLTAVSFKIIAGLMEGFEWKLTVENAENNRTDVGIDGVYEYDTFPLPAFFLKFGLEVIFQQVAVDLRSNVEEHFKKQSGGS